MRLSADSRLWTHLARGLLAALVVYVLATFARRGITYDEDWRLTYGEYVVRWYTSGFADDAALTYWTLPLEGGFFGVLAALFGRVVPLGRFDAAHLLCGLLGVATVFGAWRLARETASPRAGFLAALLLALTPRFVGHSFDNPADLPMALLLLLAVLFLARWARGLPQRGWRHVLGLGIVTGCAMATRMGGVIVVAYVGVVVAWWLLGRWRASKGAGERWRLRADLGRVLPGAVGFGLVAWLTMLPFWPAAMLRPVWRPAKSILMSTSFEQRIRIFFDGRTITNQEVPPWYVTQWLGITLPEPLLLALLLGLVAAATRLLRRRPGAASRVDGTGLFVVLTAVVVPLAYTWIVGPVDYDGMRHFLFLLPPLAVLGGIGASAFLERFPGRAVAWGTGGLLAAGCALVAVDMARLFPYEAVYFNRVVAGGLERAARSYETDYWGRSYKEGVAWVAAHVPSPVDGRRVTVGSASYFLQTQLYLPERFEYVGSVDDGMKLERAPEIYVATPRWDRHERFPGEVLHTVERCGVPLVYVVRVEADGGR